MNQEVPTDITVVVSNSRGMFLIHDRPVDAVLYPGATCLPGAWLYPGELPIDGAIRVLRDKFGLEAIARECQFMLQYRHTEADREHIDAVIRVRLESIDPQVKCAEGAGKAEWVVWDMIARRRDELVFDQGNIILAMQRNEQFM